MQNFVLAWLSAVLQTKPAISTLHAAKRKCKKNIFKYIHVQQCIYISLFQNLDIILVFRLIYLMHYLDALNELMIIGQI